MKKLFLAIGLFYSFMTVNAQEGGHVSPAATEWYTPVPAKVQPGDKPGNPPSDAIILFDGKDLSKWVSPVKDGKPVEAKWRVENGAIVIVPEPSRPRNISAIASCTLSSRHRNPVIGTLCR